MRFSSLSLSPRGGLLVFEKWGLNTMANPIFSNISNINCMVVMYCFIVLNANV